ncbi:MAG TPA: nitrate- and nitrite sensing domain-containing protein [Cellulomonas sp.]
MLRRLGIRAKVLAVLAVPMLVVLLAGAFITWESVQNLRTAQNVRGVVTAAISSVALNDALNDERAVSQVGGTADEIKAARSKTDAAVADFVPKMNAIDLSSFSSSAAGDVGEVRRDLANLLPQARQDVDSRQSSLVRSEYGTLVDDQIVLVDDLGQEIDNRPVATYFTAYTAVARTVSDLVQEEADGHALLVSAEPSAAASQSYTALAAETEFYRETARPSVAGLGIGLALPDSDPNATFQKYRQLIGTGSAQAMAAVSPASFQDEITAQRTSLSQISDNIFTTADATAARAITSAQQRALVTGGITIVAVVLSFVLAIVIARTIVIPLRRLTAAATDLREELPRLVEQVQVPGEGPQMSAPQIPVTSRDEVGRLAGAFNAVNATTFQVAQEQAALRGSIAEMFVNVARRDQVLLNRQLSFIDSLERTEEDPQALANLFRLDHLATRMRRNAESLLVLAGIDSGRRLRDTLPLSDVVRTASSEIEQYDRVELDLQADPHMLGFNALPAAHLLAELLENATVFSEPETPVVVTTGVNGPFVEVRILDLGLGMSDAELAAANEKIASTAASDSLGAQRLGLFVVGRLAQRLSTQVVLRKNANGQTGTETVVRFPATLFQSTEASPLGVYGDTSAAAAVAPEVTDFDLAALTDGVTEQGLPRRRSGDGAPLGLPARAGQRAAYDADSIMLPDVEAGSLPTDLTAASSDWTPLVIPAQSTGLPNRQPAAPDPAGTTGPERPAVPAEPAEPAARAGLFAGFRGRGDRTRVEQEPPAMSPEPAETAFHVPGLAPDEDWNAGIGQPTADAWASAEPVTDAWAAAAEDAEPVADVESGLPAGDGPAPSWSSWAANAPSWGEEATESYVPAAFASEPVDQAPLFASPASEPWTPPQDAAPQAPEQAADATADATADTAGTVDAVDAVEAPSIERWTPPTVDLAQWSVPDQEAPASPENTDAFAGLADWSAPQAEATDEPTPYAPFERSLDEARAWATGAIPVVPEPEGFPGVVPVLDEPLEPVQPVPSAVQPAVAAEPDHGADAVAWGQWNGAAEPWSTDLEIPQFEPDQSTFVDRVAELAPVPADDRPATEVAEQPNEQPADQPAEGVAEPFEPLATPAWAPTAAAESFTDLVHAEEQEAPKRRRGLFGRRKQQTAVPSAPVAPPAPAGVEPVAAAAPTLPVRSSAWAPAADAVVPEAFPTRAPAPVAEPTPAVPVSPAVPEPAPVATVSWAPQASWNPPAPPALPEPSAGRSVPSWAPPEWAPRPAQPAEPEPMPASSSVEPTSAPRIGTLDDEVAAMLALRSDIQEQALSELSQLSAYRPQVVPGVDRLTRRVPVAVPEAPEIIDTGAERNPDEVRARLASFQSGTARGRRDAGHDEETS